LIETARRKGVRIGCAPDTFLGGGLQTCRQLIDEGAIGQPVAATAFMMSPGHERWHPEPDFFYQPGGGPMFDMGPYYLTALASMLGPVRRVTGSARITSPERTITSQPRYGQKITVRVPTHVAGILDFASGVVGTIITSFDVWAAQLPRIEIYGTEGTLSVPDPNTFGGPVSIWRAGVKEWSDVPLTHGYIENSRGLGVADMAQALRSGRPHRANGDLAYHVLDIMEAFHDASREGRHIDLASSCDRPAPLPVGLRPGLLDD
jgi:predicted dehydrogenase